jgi:hypothetical protein
LHLVSLAKLKVKKKMNFNVRPTAEEILMLRRMRASAVSALDTRSGKFVEFYSASVVQNHHDVQPVDNILNTLSVPGFRMYGPDFLLALLLDKFARGLLNPGTFNVLRT